jgi:diphthamide synthase subunit DPH2
MNKKVGRPPKYNKKLVQVTLQVPEGSKEKIQLAAKKLREKNLKN